MPSLQNKAKRSPGRPKCRVAGQRGLKRSRSGEMTEGQIVAAVHRRLTRDAKQRVEAKMTANQKLPFLWLRIGDKGRFYWQADGQIRLAATL